MCSSSAKCRRRYPCIAWCTSKLSVRRATPRISLPSCSRARCCRRCTAWDRTRRRPARRRATRCACSSNRSAAPRRGGNRSRSRTSGELELLPPVPRQPQPELFKRGRDGVRGDLRVVHLPPHLLTELVRERPAALLIRPGIREGPPDPLRHFLEMAPQRLEMRSHLRYRAEVRHEQRVGRPRFDAIETRSPGREIDVWRRCRWQYVTAVDADSRGVPYECHAARRVQITHVMRGVARRVRDVERPATRFYPFATGEGDERIARHGRNLSPEPIHPIAVQARGALNQLARVGKVPRSALVNEHPDMRMPADDRAGGTAVVQMNVRQQDVPHVGPADTVLLKRELERGQAGRGPGIHERDAPRGLDDRSRDRLGSAEKHQIDPREPMRQDGHWRGDYTDGSQHMNPDPSVVLTAVARLVAEAPSLREVVSRLAVTLSESIPFERLHVLRLDRAESFVLYVATAGGELEVTGHRIGDEGMPIDPADAETRSRILCAVRQGARVHGALWVASSQERAFTEQHQALVDSVVDLLGLAFEHNAIVEREKLRRERIDSLRGLLHTVAESLDIRTVFADIAEVVRGGLSDRKSVV